MPPSLGHLDLGVVALGVVVKLGSEGGVVGGGDVPVVVVRVTSQGGGRVIKAVYRLVLSQSRRLSLTVFVEVAVRSQSGVSGGEPGDRG